MPKGRIYASLTGMTQRKAAFWTIFSCAVYILVVFFCYRATPLGQVALLDAREQQVLARNIAEGTLPAKPFYRAPLYAGTLSVFYKLGMTDEGVLLAGQLLNLVLHGLAAWALYGAARNIWQSHWAGLWAGGLYAVYPVSLYLAVDLLDATLAQALLCAGLYLATRLRQKNDLQSGLALGLCLALAILTRPQMGVISFGLLAIMILSLPKRQKVQPTWAMLILFVGTLATFGVLEWRRTGNFYILPSQGSYNLWSANRPGASGEYYAQQVELPNLPDGENPARIEALVLYQQETGTYGKTSEATVNKYWQERFWTHVKENPVEFIQLYLKKLYGLWHNHEAYNNKTYALQKEQLWPLKWNPLSFVIITLIALGVLLFSKNLPKRELASIGILTGVYWLAAAIFYTSDRFRLPMVPLVVLLAAGLPIAWKYLRQLKAGVIAVKSAVIATWATIFTLPLFGVGSRNTTSADYLLMSQAALKAGNDQQANEYSQKALGDNELSQSAIESQLQANYNLLLKGGQSPTKEWFLQQAALLQKLKEPSPEASYIAGLCQWQLQGRRDEWHTLAAYEDNPQRWNALAALLMTSGLWAEEVVLIEENAQQPALQMAKAALGNAEAKAALGHAPGTDNLLQNWRKLFDRNH